MSNNSTTTKVKRELWLVYYEHYEGIIPEAVFSSDEKAKAYMAKFPYTGAKWECMNIDLDPLDLA